MENRDTLYFTEDLLVKNVNCGICNLSGDILLKCNHFYHIECLVRKQIKDNHRNLFNKTKMKCIKCDTDIKDYESQYIYKRFLILNDEKLENEINKKNALKTKIDEIDENIRKIQRDISITKKY